MHFYGFLTVKSTFYKLLTSPLDLRRNLLITNYDLTKLWANWGHFYAPHAFSRPTLGAVTPSFVIQFQKQSILMHRRPRRNHRAHTIVGLINFRKFQFSGVCGNWNLENPKKLTHWVVLKGFFIFSIEIYAILRHFMTFGIKHLEKPIFYKVSALKNDINKFNIHLESKHHFERQNDNFCPFYRISP